MLSQDLPDVRHTWPVYGHDWAVHNLQRAIVPSATYSSGAGMGPRHAYLFLGPGQVGKSTLASAFGRALLCTGGGDRPCGRCRACQLMSRNAHPDFRLFQPLDKDGAVDRANGMLRAEQASDIIHDAALSPVEGRYKVFLVQDMHTANDNFANRLLKTLEEPPEQVVLCLTALDRNRLLPTIVSRCQTIELRPLAPTAVRDALIANWQVEPERADLLARLAGGRLGWAVRQLSDQKGAEWRIEQLEQLWSLVRAGRVARLSFAESLAAGRNNEQLFGMLEVWLSWWRDLLLAQAGTPETCSNIDQMAEIHRQAQALSPADVRGYLATLQRIEGYLRHTVNTRLALDVLVLHMPRVAGQEAHT